MRKESESQSLHHRIESIINEMVEMEIPLKEAIREFEKIYIEIATKKYKGNKTKMAKALGIHRNTLRNLARSFNLKKLAL